MTEQTTHEPLDATNEEDTDAPVTVRSEREQYRDPTPYERRLRTEAARLRVRAQAAERELETLRASSKTEAERLVAEARAAAERDVAAARTEAERVAAEAKAAVEAREAELKAEADRVTHEARTAAERRVVKAEVRAAAVAAGLVHLKGLDMLDLSQVKLDEQGEVVIPEGYFEKAQADMPFLFGKPRAVETTTSSTATPPPARPAEGKKGTEMTADEWKQKRAEIARGRI